jgi:hypothetical protein
MAVCFASRRFLRLVDACASNHFTKSDTPTLVSYVQAIQLSQSAVKKAAADPAALAVWVKATQLQTSLARALRLTVQSRSDPKVIGRNIPSGLRPPWEDYGANRGDDHGN